jgi:hypothetical protein
MRKTLLLFIVVLVVLSSCIHGPAEKRGIATMFYAYPLKDVFAASRTVLTEQGFEVNEVNTVENFMKAVKGTRIPGNPLKVILTFREEGESTWVELDKDVPAQFIPGSTAGYRMDVDDLFRYIELELDRNY